MSSNRRHAVFQLLVRRRDIEPATWRRVQVWEDTKLPQLHRILQMLFNCEDYHLHDLRVWTGGFEDAVCNGWGIVVERAGEDGGALRSIMRKLLVLGLAILASAEAARAAHRPKILIIYDMEGLSGVTRREYTLASRLEYAEGRKILTADVNAAVRGLAAGGAASIWVQDGHSSGNSEEPDILVGEMDPRAKFDFRKYPFSAYTTGLDASIDAVICVGMHARARTNGFIAHTFNLEIGYKVNGVEFSETHIVAQSAARFGIPVIMVSGDDVLGEQLREDFPDLEYAVVKTAKSRAEAVALAPGEAVRRIEERAKAAMEKFNRGVYRAYFLPPPYRFEVMYRNEEQTIQALRFPGVERAGENAVRFSATNYMDGYMLAATLFSVGNDRYDLLVRLLSNDPDARRVLHKLQEGLWERFVDADKAPEWTKPRSRAAEQRLYYGAQ